MPLLVVFILRSDIYYLEGNFAALASNVAFQEFLCPLKGLTAKQFQACMSK